MQDATTTKLLVSLSFAVLAALSVPAFGADGDGLQSFQQPSQQPLAVSAGPTAATHTDMKRLTAKEFAQVLRENASTSS